MGTPGKLALIAVLALVGCGSSELSAAERSEVSGAQTSIETFCVRSLDGKTITDRDFQDTDRAIDRVARVAREKPDALYQRERDRVPMRRVLSDSRKNVNTCRPR